MNPKGISSIVIILIIVGVLIAAGGGFWYYQKQMAKVSKLTGRDNIIINGKEACNGNKEPANETADWQTYRNEEYGFEIKYPKDWKIFSLPSGFPAHPEMALMSANNYDIRLGIYENISQLSYNEKNLSLEDWLSEILKEENAIHGYNIEYLNGLKAIRVIWQGITLDEEVMIEHSGRIYYLRSEYNSDQNGMKIFNQILCTFKFIK